MTKKTEFGQRNGSLRKYKMSRCSKRVRPYSTGFRSSTYCSQITLVIYRFELLVPYNWNKLYVRSPPRTCAFEPGCTCTTRVNSHREGGSWGFLTIKIVDFNIRAWFWPFILNLQWVQVILRPNLRAPNLFLHVRAAIATAD